MRTLAVLVRRIAVIITAAAIGYASCVIFQPAPKVAQAAPVDTMAGLYQEIGHLRWQASQFADMAQRELDPSKSANAGGLTNAFWKACKDLVFLYNGVAKGMDETQLQQLAAAGLPRNLLADYCFSGKVGDDPVEAPFDR